MTTTRRYSVTGRGRTGSTSDRDNMCVDILQGNPFDTHGAFYARSADNTYPHPGRLTGKARDLLYDRRDDIDYVVYSYSTPIAWHVHDDTEPYWVQVDDGFSVTTSRHQSIVRQALAMTSPVTVVDGDTVTFR